MQNNAIILYYEVTYILSAKADLALFYLVSRVDLEKRAQPGVFWLGMVGLCFVFSTGFNG